MVELKEKELKTLSALSQLTEPVRASDLTELTGLKAMGIGTSLRILAKGSLAELVDKRKKFWRITDSGKELAATLPALEPKPPAPSLAPSLATAPVTAPVTPPAPTVVTGKPEPLETTETIPSQSDLFKSMGERLRVGVGRGGKQEGTPFTDTIEEIGGEELEKTTGENYREDAQRKDR